MTGIVPDSVKGGIAVVDGGGLPTNPPGVTNAYIPPASFTVSCTLRYYGSDCASTRYDPQQINAIQSELICLGATINPNGAWTCGSVCNLGSLFAAWRDGTGPGSLSALLGSLICSYPSSATMAATDEVIACDGSGAPKKLTLAALSGGVLGELDGTVAAAPAVGNDPAIPTDFIGTHGVYLAGPVRWVSFTLPGVPGTITVPSYT